MSRFPVLDDLAEKAKSTLWSNQMLVKIDEETQRDAKIKNDLLQTLQVMQDGCNEREELMVKLRQLNFKLAPYKSLETIASFSIIYAFGMGMLTLSASVPRLKPTCYGSDVCSTTKAQITLCFTSLYLVALGTGGITPCVSSYGADQFDDHDEVEEKQKSSFLIGFFVINIDDNLDTSPITLSLLTTPTYPQQTPPQTNPQTTLQPTPPTPLSTPLRQTTPTPPTTPPPPPTSQHPMVTRSKFEIVKANPKYNFHVTTSSPIPKSPFYALQDPNWKQAMCDEYKALIDNNTWMKYATEILKQAHMRNCNPCRIPINTEKKLGPKGSPLIAYSDADWVGCPTTRRSTSGYYVFLGDNLLTWSSKRQDMLSRSSAEAEYRGVANAIAETSWIRNLLRELHTLLFTATLVYCDNVSAVYMSANPVQHQRTKHIEIDIHFIRDKVAAGHVQVLHVPSRFYFFDKASVVAPTDHTDRLIDPWKLCCVSQVEELKAVLRLLPIWATEFRLIFHFDCVSFAICVKGCRPMGIEDIDRWDLDNNTWGGKNDPWTWILDKFELQCKLILENTAV
nr:ribonuclease H-like domain-containing protein [Tanacetum cinerariifolium]